MIIMRPEETEDDWRLVHEALQGNHQAVNQLIGRYYIKIGRQIRGQVNDVSIMNDLVQEVCIKLFRHIRQFDNRSSFATWLYRITQNTLKNYYRSSQSDALNEGLEMDRAVDFLPNPESSLMQSELGNTLDEAIHQLPEALRDCFNLYMIGGLSYKAIAITQNCPIGTVRSRIHRTRDILRAVVEQQRLL